ncbi:hypothetical protein LAZ67_8002554, partial [Cordylochernes scorpioides]
MGTMGNPVTVYVQSFSCQCLGDYVGRWCEERDGCQGKPCQHDGYCVDIREGLTGNSFQCLCPHGYTGQRCEDTVYPCDRKPCQNGGTCLQNRTDFRCECREGYSGQYCQNGGPGPGNPQQNPCVPNPCIHGVCEDAGSGDYKCYCLPGYGGDHCEFEYDECDSSPCINSGACEDLVAGYRCHCGPGYRGRRCQIKVDLCQPNPCPAPAQCVDKGNNYSCVCHPGFNVHVVQAMIIMARGAPSITIPATPPPVRTGELAGRPLTPTSAPANLASRETPVKRVQRYICVSPEPRYPQSAASVAATVAKPGGGSPPDHLHNVYIAAATLAGACLVVLGVVAACNCRARRPYQRFLPRHRSSSLSDIKELK